MSDQLDAAQNMKGFYDAMRNQARASNALGGLGMQQGAASGLLGGNHGLMAGAAGAPIGTKLRIRMPDSYKAAHTTLTRYDGTTDSQVLVTQEWIDETQRVQARLAMDLSEAHREIGRLLAKHEITCPAVESRPDVSRIWDAIVAYSSR